MSSSIWMQCAGSSELRPMRLSAWRVVEAQHEVSTRKLVGSAAEQELLEALLEGVKPPAPLPSAAGRMHYLLFTPFRYPPLRHGSRFGTRYERGIWYGSEQVRTAFSEVAYYRLLFLEGTHATFTTVGTSLTAFTVRIHTLRGLDLTASPFSVHRELIASKTSYLHSQALGRAMREDAVEAFRYVSARDAEGGVNVGAFTPEVFHAAVPRQFQRWHCVATRETVEFTRADLTGVRETQRFSREQFVVDQRLASPAV